MTHNLPAAALSVRQPWAWAIIFASKDIENRSQAAIQHGMRCQRIAIHAAKGMTQSEYDDAARFMLEDIGIRCPPAAELARGGIIGSVDVVAIVRESDSPWFFGPRGLVLRNPAPCAFIPAVGALGYFAWREADPSIVPPPARWMQPTPAAQRSLL
ncbi:hypothetical protein IVA87_34075 [Bradyrhizobium sp. 147]|uniref:hypothetical protein n=1 Tax=Bradyrhizobium sp. 147 TaxID=2782623 RepID=UPI001FF78906|nr:hypothetical protein [Bradyrhizobium sp. 147]MCK1684282.1 hypothetical protein [Bradyrhizobium sp. 147]